MYDGSGAIAYMTGGYHTNGAELSVKQKLGDDWLAFANYTYLDPSISYLPYMPKNSIAVGINGHVSDLKLAIDAQHQSKMLGLNSSRFDANGTGNLYAQVNSFTVANVRLSYPTAQLGKKGEIFLAVENLFNTKYEYVPGYTMPGISGQIGLSASF